MADNKDENIIADENESYLNNSDLEDADIEAEEEDDDDDKAAVIPFRRKLKYIIMGLAVLLFIYATVSLINIFSEYKRGTDIYASIQAAVFSTETSSMVPEGSIAETTAFESISYADIETQAPLEDVDMASVKALSPYAVGWIQIPAIGRSYPVAYREGDNSYYLTHTFTGEENSAGCIFMDGRNYSDYSDKNTILYGHNMKNGTMFGMLNRFEDESFYNENNSNFYVTTEAGTRAYKIVAVCYVPSGSIAYTVDFSGDVTFSQFIEYISDNSLYDTGVTILPTDYVMTLSTCTSDSSTRRIVVGKYIGTIKK